MKPGIWIILLFSLATAFHPMLSQARGGGGGGGGHGGGGHAGGGHGGHDHAGFASSDSGWPATGYGYPGFDNSEYGYEDTWNQPDYNAPACDGQPTMRLFYDAYGNVYAAQCPGGAIQYFDYWRRD